MQKPCANPLVKMATMPSPMLLQKNSLGGYTISIAHRTAIDGGGMLFSHMRPCLLRKCV